MNAANHSSESHNSQEQLQDQKLDLDFSQFFNGFLKFWWVCVVLAVLFAGAMYVRSRMTYSPVYQSSVTFTVQTQTVGGSGLGVTSYSFSSNRTSAAQLSSSFPSIIQSNILQDVVCNDLNLKYFPCSLSASVVSGTNMFTITATGKDPELTYEVLCSVIRKYPDVAQYVLGNTNLYILTEPVIPTVPSNQIAYRSQMMRGALIGIVLGLAWIMLYAVMRKTVRSRTDIRVKLNQNCLGVLPEVTFKRYNKEINRSITLSNPMIGENYLESFRALRNSLLNSAGDSRVIMVTSTAPGEGKTTVSINLALSLAMMNKSVVLVDADIRNPSVSSCLGIENSASTADNTHIGKLTQLKVNSTVSMAVLNFNTVKYSMWKFFDVNNLTALIGQLKGKYDYVIVDTSPLGITSEPAVIAQVVDAAILTIRHDLVRTSRIFSALDTLMATNVTMLGCVLNGVVSDGSGYGYGRYGYGYGRYGYGYGRYGYGYGYGYGDKKKRRKSRSSSRKTSGGSSSNQ